MVWRGGTDADEGFRANSAARLDLAFQPLAAGATTATLAVH
jgi:hypothetical protein